MPSEPRRIELEITANKEGTKKIVDKLENIEGRLDDIEENLKPWKFGVIGCVLGPFIHIMKKFKKTGRNSSKLEKTHQKQIENILKPKKSEEEAGTKLMEIVGEIVRIIGFIGSIVVLIVNIIVWNNNIVVERIGLIAFAIFALMIILAINRNMEREAERQLKERQNTYREQVEKNIQLRSTENEDQQLGENVLGLIKLNLSSINEYYTWSQKQAKSAFFWATVICMAGCVLCGLGILIPVLKDNIDFKYSVIPVIGGVIADVIGGTIFFVYRKSLTQLNYYHKALHEDQRFLSSVNLISKFKNDDLGDEMLQKIIQSTIDMNLVGFACQDEEKTEEKGENKSKKAEQSNS